MASKRLNLVTGATGFSGSYVVRELLAAGEKVVATDIPQAFADGEARHRLQHIQVDLDHPDIEIVPTDLLDPESVRALCDRPITHVFHTASLYDYSASIERLRRVNVDGTRHLVDGIVDLPLQRFVHWSTCGVFGKPYTAADGEQVNLPFDERSSSPRTTDPGAEEPEGTHLVNAYSITKWEQEKLMWAAHRERGLPLTVVRPAPIYGPGSSYGHGGIILAIAHGLLRAIPADTKNFITTSVHVEDIARFAVFIAERDEGLGEDYNVVDDSIVSYHEFLHYIALLCGRNMRDLPVVKVAHLRPLMVGASHLWAWLERRLSVPRVRVLEVQSAPYVSSSYWLSNRKSLATGFSYKYPDVREGLKDTVAWMREMEWLTDRSLLLGVYKDGSKA